MPEGPTPSQTVGPFFRVSLPFEGGSEPAAADAAGAVRIEGVVYDGAGDAVPDALIEVFAGDQFARCQTDPEGAYHVTAVAPPTHFEVYVFARGLLRHLLTRIYLPEATEAVPQGVDPRRRQTLVAVRDGSILRFDIHLQGEKETVFFAH